MDVRSGIEINKVERNLGKRLARGLVAAAKRLDSLGTFDVWLCGLCIAQFAMLIGSFQPRLSNFILGALFGTLITAILYPNGGDAGR